MVCAAHRDLLRCIVPASRLFVLSPSSGSLASSPSSSFNALLVFILISVLVLVLAFSRTFSRTFSLSLGLPFVYLLLILGFGSNGERFGFAVFIINISVNPPIRKLTHREISPILLVSHPFANVPKSHYPPSSRLTTRAAIHSGPTKSLLRLPWRAARHAPLRSERAPERREQLHVVRAEVASGHRQTDGRKIRWEITPPVPWVEKEGGTRLPYFCGDVTPRELRVPPHPPSNTEHPTCSASSTPACSPCPLYSQQSRLNRPRS